MKKNLSILIMFLLCCVTARAQWSVLKDDPRIYQNRHESYNWQPFTLQQWNASNYAHKEDVSRFMDWRYGMFISYGLSSYVQKDLSWPIIYNRILPDAGHGNYPDSLWKKVWPAQWKMEKFNAEQWVNIALEAGMKYIVIIVKHHDGFHLWDTQFSDFKITNTAFKRDYFGELAAACHKANMPIGIYYSQRDWYHPDYSPVDTNRAVRSGKAPYYEAKPGQTVGPGPNHIKYIRYQYDVIRELLTKYGKIDLFWFDAAWGGGRFTADMWDAENLTRMIRQLQPDIVINNRAGIPGDFDTPEQQIGMYQNRPWESAMTINGSWAYDPTYPNKPVKKLIREMLQAASGNGNILLSWGANFDGAFNKAQTDTLLRIGKWLQQYGKAYYETRGGPWMPTRDFGSVYKNKTVFLYIYNWSDTAHSFPALPGNTIQSVQYLNLSEKVNWQLKNNRLLIQPPLHPNDIVSIVQINFSKPVQNKLQTENNSIFNNPAYGAKILKRAINTGDWKENELLINLGSKKNVTIIHLKPGEETGTIAVSENGENWETIEGNTLAVLSTEMTGAIVPGKKIQYIKIKNTKPFNTELEIFAR